ncbi:MAG TPA: hypothetical protein VFD92_19375 [Candidatus Binatia bacterium]|nr:hypothetical protein [Candidatus Binatia bacterium]
MAETEKKKESALPAIIGWGGLALFSVLFGWIILNQLRTAEEWSNRGPEAITLVKQFKPDGGTDTMEDLIRGYSIKAKEKGGYVGEFAWEAKQKEGPEYEVTMLWRDGEKHKTALWRVDLRQKQVRPQGDAATLPKNAREGNFG